MWSNQSRPILASISHLTETPTEAVGHDTIFMILSRGRQRSYGAGRLPYVATLTKVYGVNRNFHLQEPLLLVSALSFGTRNDCKWHHPLVLYADSRNVPSHGHYSEHQNAIAQNWMDWLYQPAVSSSRSPLRSVDREVAALAPAAHNPSARSCHGRFHSLAFAGHVAPTGHSQDYNSERHKVYIEPYNCGHRRFGRLRLSSHRAARMPSVLETTQGERGHDPLLRQSLHCPPLLRGARILPVPLVDGSRLPGAILHRHGYKILSILSLGCLFGPAGLRVGSAQLVSERAHVLLICTRVPSGLLRTIFIRGGQIFADVLVIGITWRATYHAFSEGSKCFLARVTFEHGTLYFVILLVLNILHTIFIFLPNSLLHVPFTHTSYVTRVSEPITAILVSRFILDLHETHRSLSEPSGLTGVQVLGSDIGRLGSRELVSFEEELEEWSVEPNKAWLDTESGTF